MDFRAIIKLYKKTNKIIKPNLGLRYCNFCWTKLIWLVKKLDQFICKFLDSISS